MRRYIAFIIFFLGLHSAHAAEGNAAPTFQLSGDVTLTSHYVEYGLSQSDKSPALQGSFWFNFGPQFRLGLWGSNTNYDHGNDYFNLRMNADVKVQFSQHVEFVIAYSHSQYYNGGNHNGDILGAHLHLGDYRVGYESNSNWEATNEKSIRYAFGKISNIGTWKWNNEVGYNSPDVSDKNPYFDARTGLGTKWGVIFVEGALTGTSESSQFDGAGDLFFILSASTDL